MNDQELWRELGQQLRVDSVRAAAAAGSGHPTSSMSAADLMAVLLAKYLRYDFDSPENPMNDHLIFSKGHASPLVYSIFKAAGAITDDGAAHASARSASRFQGHPTPILPWVDVATGSLGQGLPIAVGIALAGKRLDRLPYRVWVVCGDSEMAEGSMWEAFAAASHESLDNLIAIIDVNRLGQRGETMLGWNTAAYARRAEAFGWRAIEIDGHDVDEIDAAYEAATAARRPAGRDHRPHAEGQGRRRGREQERLARQAAGGPRGGHRRAGRQARPAGAPAGAADRRRGRTGSSRRRSRRRRGTSARRWRPAGPTATRWSRSARATAAWSRSTARSATRPSRSSSWTPIPTATSRCTSPSSRWSRRRSGMQVRGWRPFASTFAAFLARAYDFIRMAAISQANIRLAGSHAGVSIGEDGPSQMALEDLASFRAVHGSTVLYPSCANQTARLVEQMADRDGIVYLRTTRESLPVLYPADEPFPIGGSRVIRSSDSDDVTIVGAGITLHEALAAAETLAGEGIAARVIDLYSVKPIDAATLAEAARRPAASSSSRTTGPRAGSHDAVLEALNGAGVNVPVTGLAPTGMPTSGTPAELLDQAGHRPRPHRRGGALAGRREAVTATPATGARPRFGGAGPHAGG